MLMTAEERVQILEQQLQQKDEELAKEKSRVIYLQEQLALAKLRQFGRSSEQFANDKQIPLFEEAIESGEESNDDDSSQVSSYERKKQRGKRKPLPTCLERVRVEHKLNESELIGPDGERYIKIGEDISEQLDIVPADVRVIQHVRFKYAVKGKEELGVKIAPITGQVIPKSIASSGLLAHMVEAKYCHHLPLYRQEQIWLSLDVSIPRNSMTRWVLELGEKAQPIVEELIEQIKSQRHLHVDETRVTVIQDKNKKPDNPSHNGFMWVYTNAKAVVYDYQSSRAGEHAYKMLEDYSGYVQTDAYAGYNQLFLTDERISVGCMAHARRKFTDVLKSAGKKKKNGNAQRVVDLIAKLYKIEKHCLENRFTNDERQHYRQEKSKPILNQIKQLLDDLLPKAPPESLLGKAISYTLKNWPQLTRYLEDGCIPLDNNEAERKIRPFTIGRKNWMFCGNTRGAKASANLYSLIESAKLYNLKIFDYLKHVFQTLPEANSVKDFEKLTPKYCHHLLPKIKSKPPR